MAVLSLYLPYTSTFPPTSYPGGIADSERVLPKGDVMKRSARNVLKGKVVNVTRGAVTAHVKIEVAMVPW